jgi:pimeloyl-ACP methyl ester carboxylesterase
MSVLLLHGAWQGRWAWDRLLPFLAEAGLDAHALDLPGNGNDGVDPADVSLDLYVDTILRWIDARSGRVSIVAHSGSGIVASQIGETCPDRVNCIVYVAGMMLPDGVAYADLVASLIETEPAASGIGPHLVWSANRLSSEVPVDVARHFFFHDCSRDLAEAAARRLTPQPERGRAIRPRLSSERFGRVRRFYVEALADRSVVPAAQRRMQELLPGATVTALPTGHAPQLSAPWKLADCLIPWLRQAASADGNGASIKLNNKPTGNIREQPTSLGADLALSNSNH